MHANQTLAIRGGCGGGAATVIEHLQPENVIAVLELDVGSDIRSAVFESIGERFLDDSVSVEVDPDR